MAGAMFNLLDSRWILAVNKEGRSVELTLTEVFKSAHEIIELSGELPAQDVAILRLLLGILYAVFFRMNERGAPYDADENDPDQMCEFWERLWRLGQFPSEVIERYLYEYYDRFWLVHPEKPFWQVTFDKKNMPKNKDGISITPYQNKTPMLIGDIAEGGNKVRLFQSRIGVSKNAISFSEATRWLIYLNAFDVSPLGNPGKNPKKINGFGQPWPAGIGMTWVSGDTLFQTLLLNLALEYKDDSGLAWWETEMPCRTAEDLERRRVAAPNGLIPLMSMQYRYTRLQVEGDRVTGFDLWSGVNLDIDFLEIEKMTPWVNEDNKVVPKKHSATKQLWRDFAAFMPHYGNPPGVIKWVSDIKDRARVELPAVRINIVGILYKQNTKAIDIFSDALAINSELLSKLNEGWVTRITNTLETTDKLVGCVGTLAGDLAKAVGASDSSVPERRKLGKIRSAAREEAYFRLDTPFRDWLAKLDPGQNSPGEASLYLENELIAWTDIVKGIILALGEEMVNNAGTRAYVGKELNSDMWMTAPGAYNKFIRLVIWILYRGSKKSEVV